MSAPTIDLHRSKSMAYKLLLLNYCTTKYSLYYSVMLLQEQPTVTMSSTQQSWLTTARPLTTTAGEPPLTTTAGASHLTTAGASHLTTTAGASQLQLDVMPVVAVYHLQYPLLRYQEYSDTNLVDKFRLLRKLPGNQSVWFPMFIKFL